MGGVNAATFSWHLLAKNEFSLRMHSAHLLNFSPEWVHVPSNLQKFEISLWEVSF